MRLYLTHAEVESIARGTPLASASAKAQAKLRPAAPIEGQTDLLTELARIEDHDADARSSSTA